MPHIFRQTRPILSIALISLFLIAIAGGPAGAWEVTLAWDPNNEPKLDGYTVYCAKHTPGPPYDYVGDLPLNELPNPDMPMASLTDLEEHVNYYFALTAYDSEGNESSFSRELCVRADGNIISECAPASSVSLGTGGGSGGFSACYIQTAGAFDRYAGPSAIAVLVLSLAAALACILSAIVPRSIKT